MDMDSGPLRRIGGETEVHLLKISDIGDGGGYEKERRDPPGEGQRNKGGDQEDQSLPEVFVPKLVQSGNEIQMPP